MLERNSHYLPNCSYGISRCPWSQQSSTPKAGLLHLPSQGYSMLQHWAIISCHGAFSALLNIICEIAESRDRYKVCSTLVYLLICHKKSSQMLLTVRKNSYKRLHSFWKHRSELPTWTFFHVEGMGMNLKGFTIPNLTFQFQIKNFFTETD